MKDNDPTRVTLDITLPIQVLLIILKVAGYIHVSWFWVLTPLWLPCLIFLLVFLFIMFVALLP